MLRNARRWGEWPKVLKVYNPALRSITRHKGTLVKFQLKKRYLTLVCPGNISNEFDIESFRANRVNPMRNGNVPVVHSSIATDQARGGSGAATLF